MANKDINRIKVVLVDKKKTNKWLAEQLGKDQTTISKWCTNTSQPDIESLMKIAKLLGVELAELVRFEQIQKVYLEVIDYQLFVVNTVEKWIGFYLWVYGK